MNRFVTNQISIHLYLIIKLIYLLFVCYYLLLFICSLYMKQPFHLILIQKSIYNQLIEKSYHL